MNDSFERPWAVVHKNYPLLFKSGLAQEKIEALIKIGYDDGPGSLQYLFPLLFSREPSNVKAQVAKSIDSIFARTLEKCRSSMTRDVIYALHNIDLSVEQVKLLRNFVHSDMLIAIASFNYNGYVREASLDEWKKTPKKDLHTLLPALVPRLNDYVPIIREKANKLYLEALMTSTLEGFLANYELINRYEHSKHIENSDLMADIRLFIKKTPMDKLLNNLKQYQTGEQIFILRILLEDLHNDYSLFEAVLKNASSDTKRWLASATRSWEFPEHIMKQLLQDPSQSLKQAALWKIKEQDLDLYKDYILRLACDSVRRVRYSARFLLRLDNSINIHDYYCILVDKADTPQVVSMLGLLETSTMEDLERIKSYLSHGSKVVRALALTSLSRLKVPELLDYALTGLLDQSSTVRKSASSIIKKSSPIKDDEIRSLMISGPKHARPTCFSVLVSRNDWQALIDILKVLLSEQDISIALREQALKALSRWHFSVYIKPSQAVYDEMIKYLDLVELKYGPDSRASYLAKFNRKEIEWLGYK